MPLFTIATVTQNNVQGLEKTWKSIQKQNFKDIEWLIQDGASTDKSLNLLKKTTAKIESTTDQGIYDAMNRLIERATGDYILFLNAGDMLASLDTLNLIAGYLEKRPDFIYGDSLEAQESKRHYKSARNHKHIALGMFTHHQSMLFKRETIGDLRYNLKYSIAADYEFTARFLKRSKTTKYISSPICIFESGGISQQKTALGRNEQFQIRKQLKLCSALQNKVITNLQFLNIKFRKLTPSLYWSLKNR